MTIYTYVGNKRTADWAIKEITIGRNADGTPKTLKLGESADIDPATYKYLSDRFKLVAGQNVTPDPTPANPNKGDKGDPGMALLQPVPDELTVAVNWTSPMQRPILSGSFVAGPTGKALAQFPVTHQIAESGGSWVSWNLYWGADGLTPLTPKHQGDALPAGVFHELLGATTGVQATGVPETLLTGLTPGQKYNYELSIGLVGGAGQLYVPGGSSYVHTSKTPAPWPDGTLITAVKDAQVPPNLHIFKSDRQYGRLNETQIASFVLPTGALGRLRVTPDGSRIAVCNLTDGSVSVFTTGAQKTVAQAAGAAALQGKYVFPGVTPRPLDLAVLPDNVTAWVMGNHDTQAHIHKLDLTTGVFSTDYNIGAASLSGSTITVTPDGLYAVLAYNGDSKVRKVRLSDGQVTVSPNLPGCKCAKVTPDGAFVIAGTGGQAANQLYKLNIADLSIAAQVTVQGSTPNVENIGIFADGRAFLAVCSNIAGGSAIKQYEVADLSNYTSWGNLVPGGVLRDAIDIAITQNGTIYVTNQQDPILSNWMSGSFIFTPNSTFFQHRLRARIVGVA